MCASACASFRRLSATKSSHVLFSFLLSAQTHLRRLRLSLQTTISTPANMSTALRASLRAGSRATVSRSSCARPAVRRSQRFFSASQPGLSNSNSNARTLSVRTASGNFASGTLYGLGAVTGIGLWLAYFSEPVKLEAIDFGNEDGVPSRTSSPLFIHHTFQLRDLFSGPKA